MLFEPLDHYALSVAFKAAVPYTYAVALVAFRWWDWAMAYAIVWLFLS